MIPRARAGALLLAVVAAAPAAAAQQIDLEAILERGTAAMQAGDVAGAEAAFREALAAAPGHPYAGAMLGNALLDMNRGDEALLLLQAAVREAPELQVAWTGLARAWLARGDAAAAIEPLRNALRLAPEDNALRLQLAQTLRQAGRTEEALDIARAAADADPAEPLGTRLVLALLLELEREPEALDLLAAFLQKNPEDRAALVLYGDILVQADLGLDARIAAAEAWQRALSLQPGDLELVRRLIALYFELGLYTEAIALLDGVPAAATDAGLMLWRGRLLARQQRYAAAIEAYQGALALEESAAAWYQIGVARANLNDFEAAIAAFERALQLDPDMATGYRELGKVLSDRGQHDEAATVLARAVTMLPEDATALALAGAAELRAGRPEAALVMLDRAIARAPGDPQPLYDRAIALRQLGRADESRAAMEVFRAAESRADATGDSEQVLRARARGAVQQGMTRLRLVGAEAALPYFDQAIDLDEAQAVAWYGKGLCHARQGQWSEAATAFERNVALDPERPDGYAGLAEAYARLGRPGDAERMRARASELLAKLRQQ